MLSLAQGSFEARTFIIDTRLTEVHNFGLKFSCLSEQRFGFLARTLYLFTNSRMIRNKLHLKRDSEISGFRKLTETIHLLVLLAQHVGEFSSAASNHARWKLESSWCSW